MKDLFESGDDKMPSYYWCLDFSADKKFLATGQEGGDVKVSFVKQAISPSATQPLQIWIVTERRVRNTFKHDRTVHSLHFSPNVQSIAIGDVVVRRLRDGFSSKF